MVERVRAYVEQWNMIGQGDIVLAGVSGGADSVCLCLVLRELSKRMHFTLRVVHVEHGIRGEESLTDAAFVEQLCEGLSIPFALREVDVPAAAKTLHMSEEEAARKLRYEAFADEVKEAGCFCEGEGRVRVALAHHMEDNAETMLFSLVRGTGLDGLCGMAPVREDPDGCVYIRPLLAESRSAIEDFLAAWRQDYCQDSTNLELDYSRNRIRHKVLPELTAVNAQAVSHMNQTAERLRELREYLEGETDRAYEKALCRRTEMCQDDRADLQEQTKPVKKEVCLQIFVLKDIPSAIRQRVLHRAIAETAGARKDIAAVHIQAVENLMDVQSGKRIRLPYDVVAGREYDTLYLRRMYHADAVADNTWEASGGMMRETAVTEAELAGCMRQGDVRHIPLEGKTGFFTLRVFSYEGNPAEISSKMYTKWFDYDKIKDGFLIRNCKSGDYFIMDETGHRKKLERYFIDRKLPAAERKEALLLAQGSEVLWLVGGRMGRSAMVTADTRRIVEITYQGGSDNGL